MYMLSDADSLAPNSHYFYYSQMQKQIKQRKILQYHSITVSQHHIKLYQTQMVKNNIGHVVVDVHLFM